MTSTEPLKAFGHPNYTENARRCRSGEQPCAFCGKPIKKSRLAEAVWVEICCRIINPDESHDPHGARNLIGHERHGAYPLGPDCYKKWKASRA